MKFLLWVLNRNGQLYHGQLYLLFYAIVIYFLVRGEGLHMVCSDLFSIMGHRMQGNGHFCSPAPSSEFYSEDFVGDTNTVCVSYEQLHSLCSLFRQRACKFTVEGTQQ